MHTPRVSSPISLARLWKNCARYRYRDLSRRTLCAHNNQELSHGSTGKKSAKSLEKVTLVSRTSDAVRAVKNLIELGPAKCVAWSIQNMGVHKNPNNPAFMTLGAYAGKDVDFGSGSHLFIRGQCEAETRKIWDLLKGYFEDEECMKICLDYSSLATSLSKWKVEPRGFKGDLVHMAMLTGTEVPEDTLDAYAKAFLKRKAIGVSSTVLDVSGVPPDGEVRPVGASAPEDIMRAAQGSADASLVYLLFEELQTRLKASSVDGMNGTYDFQSEFADLYEVYSKFFMPFVGHAGAMQKHSVNLNWDVLYDEKRERVEQSRFRKARFLEWACKFSPDSALIDLKSRWQLRQLLFAPCRNIHVKTEMLPETCRYRVTALKADSNQNDREALSEKKGKAEVEIRGYGAKAMVHTAKGWPSVSKPALRKAAGRPRANKPNFGQRDKEFCYAVDDLLASMALQEEATRIDRLVHALESDKSVRSPLVMNSETGYFEWNVDGKGSVGLVKRSLSAAQGNMLVVGQYRNLELWLLAQISRCNVLRARLESRADFHELGAYELFENVQDAVDEGRCGIEGVSGVEGYELDSSSVAGQFPSEYRQAGVLDAGVTSGGSVRLISKSLGLKQKECRELLAKWYKRHPGVSTWMKECIEFAKSEGYVETILGRRKLTKNLKEKERVVRENAKAAALRYVLTGSAGEAVMGAVVKLGTNETLRALGWRLVLIDGPMVILEGPEYAVDVAKPIVFEGLRAPWDFELDLYLDAIVESGASLAAIEMKKYSNTGDSPVGDQESREAL